MVSATGMTLTSWYYGVTGGLYGRLVGHVSIVGLLLMLLVPAVLLTLVGWRLRYPGSSAASGGETESGIRLAA